MLFIKSPFKVNISQLIIINLLLYIIISLTSLQDLKIAIYIFCFIIWYFIWKNKAELNLRQAFILFSTTAIFSCLSTPFHENDFYRYYIDGLHLEQEIPVFSQLPEKSILRAENTFVFEQADYLDYGSIYPIVVVSFFSLLVKFSFGDFNLFVILLRLVALILPVLIFYLVAKKKSIQSPFCYSLLLVSCPLFVSEWYQNLHFDFLLSLLILMTIYVKSNRLKLFFLAIGLHVKYAIFLLLGFIKLKKSHWVRNLFFFIFCNLVILFLYPSFEELAFLFKNLLLFGSDWEMNSGLFRLERSLMSLLYPTLDSVFSTFFFNTCLLITIFGWLRFKNTSLDLEHKIWLFFQIFILISPIVNPWYMTWTLPVLLMSSRVNHYFLISIVPVYLSYTFHFSDNYLIWFNIEHVIMWWLIILGLKRHSTMIPIEE